MLFEEYEKGTGVHSSEEYDLANKLYSAMPEGFSKQKMFDLRNSMDADDFKALCELATKNQDRLDEERNRNEYLTKYAGFIKTMIATLKMECNINCLEVYTAHMADKAARAEKERIGNEWRELWEQDNLTEKP